MRGNVERGLDAPSMPTLEGSALWTARLVTLAQRLLIAVGIVLISMALFSGVLIEFTILFAKGTDFDVHIAYAAQWAASGTLPLPHFLFHASILTFNALLKGDGVTLPIASFFVCLIATMFLGAIAFQFFVEQFVKRTLAAILISLVLMTGLVILAPITLFTMGAHNLYFGYIVATVYHNPTMYILKPLALLNFIVIVRTLLHPDRFRSVGWIVAIAALTVLSILAKPNYMLDMLPAYGLCVAYLLVRRKKINWMMAIFGVVLPAVIVLGWQEYFAYVQSATQTGLHLAESHIIFAPFLVVSDRSTNILPKFFLSILFPLVVYVLYFDKARRDPMLNMAWLIFILGAIQMYFLAETGLRLDQANFWWSAEIGLFILFAVTLGFLIRNIGRRVTVPSITVGAIFLVQVFCGIVFLSVNGHWW